MTNILTAQQAANACRCDMTDPDMLDLLPMVDSYIQKATGRDWTKDTPIEPVAIAAARILLVMWHEDPAMMAIRNAPLQFGMTSLLVTLESIALKTKTFQGNTGLGGVTLLGAVPGDLVSTLTGVSGVTGDQHTQFETVITLADQIQQLASVDLSANWYRVYLIRWRNNDHWRNHHQPGRAARADPDPG